MLGCAILENREPEMELSVDRKVTIFAFFFLFLFLPMIEKFQDFIIRFFQSRCRIVKIRSSISLEDFKQLRVEDAQFTFLPSNF